MALNIPKYISKEAIDITIEALSKAEPYPEDVFRACLGSENSDKYDKDRERASMAKHFLINEGIDFNEFMKEYVNKE